MHGSDLARPIPHVAGPGMRGVCVWGVGGWGCGGGEGGDKLHLAEGEKYRPGPDRLWLAVIDGRINGDVAGQANRSIPPDPHASYRQRPKAFLQKVKGKDAAAEDHPVTVTQFS